MHEAWINFEPPFHVSVLRNGLLSFRALGQDLTLGCYPSRQGFDHAPGLEQVLAEPGDLLGLGPDDEISSLDLAIVLVDCDGHAGGHVSGQVSGEMRVLQLIPAAVAEEH